MSRELFPPIEPSTRGALEVGDGHRIYYEVSGNPAGRPVVFLHGGPGSCTGPAHRRFFDPAYWRIVLFDQRGCGQSTPLGSLRGNDTRALVGDIERLRQHLGVEQWMVFGGSWGSTLALAYGIAHPQRVTAFVLRGVFLASDSELAWFLSGLRAFLPEAWQRFAGSDAGSTGRDLLASYRETVMNGERADAVAAARRWDAYETAQMSVGEAAATSAPPDDDTVLAGVRVQVHYVVHDCFLAPNELLDGTARLRDHRAIIVHGRRDLVCPPIAAYELAQRWPRAELRIVEEGGHSAMHPAMASALVQAAEDLK